MARQDSSSIGTYVVGVVCGVALTYAWVWFGYSLPGVVRLAGEVASEATVSTAETGLYSPDADIEVQQRALAVLVAHRPELFIDVDTAIDHQFLEEVLRRKAFRKTKLIRQQFSAYETALSKPALRKRLESRHNVTETEALKRRMLVAAVHEDEFLNAYLQRHFPDHSGDRLAEFVLDVYRHQLRPAPNRVATESTGRCRPSGMSAYWPFVNVCIPTPAKPGTAPRTTLSPLTFSVSNPCSERSQN